MKLRLYQLDTATDYLDSYLIIDREDWGCPKKLKIRDLIDYICEYCLQPVGVLCGRLTPEPIGIMCGRYAPFPQGILCGVSQPHPSGILCGRLTPQPTGVLCGNMLPVPVGLLCGVLSPAPLGVLCGVLTPEGSSSSSSSSMSSSSSSSYSSISGPRCTGDCGYYGLLYLTINGCSCISGTYALPFKGDDGSGNLVWADPDNPVFQSCCDPPDPQNNWIPKVIFKGDGCYYVDYNGCCGVTSLVGGIVVSCSPVYLAWDKGDLAGTCFGCNDSDLWAAVTQ